MLLLCVSYCECSTVERARDRENGDLVAIKKIKTDSEQDGVSGCILVSKHNAPLTVFWFTPLSQSSSP